MFRLMRNIHLGLGLGFVVMAVIFAVSSLYVIYRPWLPSGERVTRRVVSIPAEVATTPRALALELMRNHGMRGDMLDVVERGDSITFSIFRPGAGHGVAYSRATGEARIVKRTWGPGEIMLQIHSNHGFWHESLPEQIWSVLSLLTSIGLLLLGASGIYLWYAHRDERVVGAVLLTAGLGFGLFALVLTRMAP